MLPLALILLAFLITVESHCGRAHNTIQSDLDTLTNPLLFENYVGGKWRASVDTEASIVLLTGGQGFVSQPDLSITRVPMKEIEISIPALTVLPHNTAPAPLELRLIHYQMPKNVTVVSYHFFEGNANTYFEPIFASLATLNGGSESSISLDFVGFQPFFDLLSDFEVNGYWQFSKSPSETCGEAISSFVLSNPGTVSTQQLDIIRKLFGQNQTLSYEPMKSVLRYAPASKSDPGTPSALWLGVAVVATVLLLVFFSLIVYWHKYGDGQLDHATWKQPDQL